MKKVLIMLAFVVGAVSFSKAQGQGGGGQGGFTQRPPEERAQATLDGQALASLNLTADQKAKTLPLLVKMNKSLDSLMATVTVPAGGDRQAAMQTIMPKRTEISTSYEKTFVTWLTADQKKAYDTALAAAKERNPNATGILGGRGFGGRGGQGGGGQGGGGQRPQGGATPAAPGQ